MLDAKHSVSRQKEFALRNEESLMRLVGTFLDISLPVSSSIRSMRNKLMALVKGDDGLHGQPTQRLPEPVRPMFVCVSQNLVIGQDFSQVCASRMQLPQELIGFLRAGSDCRGRSWDTSITVVLG